MHEEHNRRQSPRPVLPKIISNGEPHLDVVEQGSELRGDLAVGVEGCEEGEEGGADAAEFAEALVDEAEEVEEGENVGGCGVGHPVRVWS